MKVSEAINLADKYAGSPIESELKYRWLQQIEDIIYKEVILNNPKFKSRISVIKGVYYND